MRVNYTLPELEPGSFRELSSGTEQSLTFREQLRGLALPLPRSWEHALRLETRPFTATYINPPTRPANIEVQDAEAERSRWRNMLVRQTRMSDASMPQLTSRGRQPVQLMLEMLQGMQDMEDAIVAQGVALTRG